MRTGRGADPPANSPVEMTGRRGFAALLLVLLAAVPQTAIADTIYLTNGRVIHTEEVRIEGDMVIFRQLGGEVSIPRSAVARIVDDDEVEQSARPATGAAAPAPDAGVAEAGDETGGTRQTAGAEAGSGSSDAAGGSFPAAPPGTDSEGAADDPSRAAYWVEQIVSVDERIARAKLELERLPVYEATDRRLLRFSGRARFFVEERDRWEGLLRDFEATRRQIMEGARRAGISPGALRDGLERAARGGSVAGGTG